MQTHQSDEDCAGHIVDGECSVCGVTHVETCGECDGSGYHRAHCSQSDDPTEHTGAHSRTQTRLADGTLRTTEVCSCGARRRMDSASPDGSRLPFTSQWRHPEAERAG